MDNRIPERKRGKFRGRGKDHSFLRLPHFIITSPQWRALSGNAIKFLIELASHYNGHNNGDLSFTKRQCLERGWRSAGTRDRAAKEAVDAGFAVVTRQGGKNACNLYAVTWLAIDDVGKGCLYAPEHAASHQWKKLIGLPHNGANQAPSEGQPW
jgi:hypothetical protein